MMAVQGIGRMLDVLRKLSETPRRVAQIASPKLTELLQKEYADGTDPYGRAWKPLMPSTIAKGRRNPPLTDTLKLSKGTKAYSSRVGIRLVVGAPYGYFHQVGFRVGRTKVPPRRILPQFGLPAAWKKVLTEAARQASREARG